MAKDLNNTGRVEQRYLEEEMKDSYLSYAMSVIVGRALPDIRDGLKPVQRRILYTMSELNLRYNQPHKKSARIVGECLGKYHPHGDVAVYDALVRMAQDFSLRYPLVDGQGNFGSQDGDPPAAMRYTEARLSKISDYLLQDIDKDTVDFFPNFDNSLKEPRILPAVLPNLILNGASGIAVGMATNIPPHNLGEVTQALVYLIEKPDCSIKELAKIIKGPDFPTGGIICGRSEILKAYQEGRGRLTLRAKATIEEAKSKHFIVITELPYQVNKSSLLESIANLINSKKIEGVSDLRDESDKEGLRIVLELKRDTEPRVILNQLYKHTTLETTFGAIFLALVNNRPQLLNLKQILQHHIQHRKEIIVRRSNYELEKAKRRAHILEGLKIALKFLDRVIETIKKSKTVSEAKASLIKKFKLTDIQAQAILELQLQRLTALERDKLNKEYLETIKKIEELQGILSSEKKQEALIKEELKELQEKFSDSRRTEIVAEKEEIQIEDLIVEEDVVITITHSGYIKRQPLSSYRRQARGGRGITAMATKEEDFVEHLFVSSSKDTLLIFSTKGKAYALKTYQIPQGSRTSKGRAIVNILNLSSSEKITAVLSIKEFREENFLIMATQQGLVKRTSLNLFSNLRKTGIIAISLDKDDSLISVCLSGKDTDEVILNSWGGKAIRFPVSQVRPTGRTSKGIRAIKLSKGDRVLGMVLVNSLMKKGKFFLFTVTEKGFAKRTPLSEYRLQSRAGKGIIASKVSPKTGKVVSAILVAEEDEVIVISQKGVLIRTLIKNIRTSGRATQGVRIIRLDKDNTVSSAARIIEKEEGGS
ncbi:MAG TPA: DNA gyrase subunit A [Candidatus Omnitrophica bacterium]|nr:MAG: DNA gyrase subunit A [Candidatus Omnitrophota bacterium]RKY35826.1 MAG: DNA gyrase subunit A [Candidatus Omnitrophota bacterium]RKY44634.1 MAG: DNA gyrase subunit A [Candidatus Omnitrophota bacterium]HEC70149.1 DNA gyrase subunit A [Candidatus Omnitrophota bacterium]